MHDARVHQWLKGCVLQEGKARAGPERGVKGAGIQLQRHWKKRLVDSGCLRFLLIKTYVHAVDAAHRRARGQ